jgi:simple sugar transport system substrate-binding protein
MRSAKAVIVSVVLIMSLVVMGVGFAQDSGDEFVFGVVLVGPADDGGWSQAHVEGAEYVLDNLPGSRMLLFESLNSADNPGTTLFDVVSIMVDEGAELILTTSDAFVEDTVQVASQFPDVTFVNISGDSTATGEAPPNLGNFTGQLLIPRMIAGCAAALTTETGSIGLIGPLINHETRRDQASAYLGARYCWENYRGLDPDDLFFEVVWIGFWFHIPGVTLDPTEVSHEFFDRGIDVIISGIDTLEPLRVTEQRHERNETAYFIGTDSHRVCAESASIAEVCLGTQYYNWGPSYLVTAEAVQAGTWEQGFEWNGPDWDDINNLETTHVGFVYGEGLGEDVRELVDDFIAHLAAFATDPDTPDNVLPLWVGPLNYQDGTLLVDEGEYLPAFLLEDEGPSVWYLEQLLEGMSGASQ